MSVNQLQAPGAGAHGPSKMSLMSAEIERSKTKLAKVATRYLGEDRLAALAIAIWSKNRRLQSCSPTSFLRALYEACQLGLDPTGVGNQGHIVAYRGEAKFIRGWGGVVTMAARRGINVDTFAVYDSDEFEVARYANEKGYFLGLHHVEKRENPEEIGAVRAAYAVASCKDWDQPMIEVVWRHDVEKIRKNSASPNSPAWKEWYSEMARKTAVNRLAKRLPLFVDVKELNDEGKVEKRSLALNSVPYEDTYYDGSVGNKQIDAPIPGDTAEPAAPQPAGNGQLNAISEALGLRESDQNIYSQVFGRKDITKMGKNELLQSIERVKTLIASASRHSEKEVVEHEQSVEAVKMDYGDRYPDKNAKANVQTYEEELGF